MPKKDYIIFVDGTSRIFVVIETEKGTITRFVVKLEILVKEKWVEIERYDTHHGHVHKDILGRDRKKKRVLKYYLVDNESGLNMAINDFKENHQIYSWRYLNDKA